MDETKKEHRVSAWVRLFNPDNQAISNTPALYQGAKRRFWAWLVPLTVIVFVAFYYAFYLLERIELSEIDGKTNSAIELARSHANHDFKTVYGDLKFIAGSDLTNRFLLERDQPKSRKEIERAFYNMVKTHRIYDQMRLLSETGEELVRVNYNLGNPNVVAIDQLQDKSERYYFKEALKVTGNRIYVSPMDLNMEGGQIERPFKPMIRFAQPIRDRNSNLIGVVVLNYLAGTMLDSFRQQMSELPGKSMLLNSDGYWLSSDNREQEWGFMFNSSSSFSNNYPGIWHQMQAQNHGILETNQGRYTFTTVQPLPPEVIANTPESHTLDDWTIIVINRIQGVGVEFLLGHLSYMYPLFIAYPIGLLLLWFWAKAASGREIAEDDLRALNHSLEHQVLRRTEELQATKDVTILSLATLAETRDNETGQHIRRTQNYIKLLANTIKNHPDFHQQLDGEAIKLIFKSAPLHDIGKVGVPDAILLKPTKLTDDEFEIMKKHTTYGSDAIQEAIYSLSTSLAIDGKGTFLHYARDIAHYHHERWDGTGYPSGLAGEAIPLAARMMALADVYDALVTQRVYKKAFSREVAEEIILCQSHGQFDPRILQAFEQIKDQFWQVRIDYAEQGDNPSVVENPDDVNHAVLV